MCSPPPHTTHPLQSPPDWHEILTYFRGSELQNYFTKILEDDLKVPQLHCSLLTCLTAAVPPLQACIKPQYVDQIPRAVKVRESPLLICPDSDTSGDGLLQGTVQVMLDKKDELNVQDSVCEEFGMCSGLCSSVPVTTVLMVVLWSSAFPPLQT